MSGISAWLGRLGLESYAAVFVENAIDLDILPDLNEADLERMGVALGHRKRILKAAAALSDGSTPAGTSSASVAAGHAPEAERRHLTVLFCDIVGSTAMAVKLDPEDLSGVIRRFQTTCATVITHGGGYIARFMGDGLLAYFGYPQAHEDDAESAVRTGLDLVSKVGQLLLPSNEPLQVRVGIATGLVVVDSTIGDVPAREQAVTGETPNLAARLQSLAPPNSVVIAESTRKLLGEGFVCERIGPFEIKGVPQPVTSFRISGERAVESRFEARQRAKLTQFVGRQHQLHQLADSWTQAGKGIGQVVLLCGEPGIGKSRTTIALFDLIAGTPHTTIRCQCSSHHRGSPYYPLVRQLSRAAGFERDDEPEIKIKKLENLLSRAGSATLQNAAHFAAMLSIPSETRYPQPDLTPKRRKDMTIAALLQYLEGLASVQPVLLVWEDVHWIDPTTLEVLDQIIEAAKSIPVLVLVTFRPEFFPTWLGHSHVRMIRLDRLGRGQVEEMIVDITGGKELPAEVSEQIVSKTDGVPLFVEELTKAVMETGLLKDAGDRYVTAESLPVPAVPASLHDSLMARLDRLAPIKEIAQIGAAIGREFSYRLLAAVSLIPDAPLKAALAQLGAADLVHGRGEPPNSTYIFKHALVQDTAYSSLMRSKRQQLHSRIANALREQFSETVETQPELMAYHLEQAGLTEQAIDFLRVAGLRAIERSANTEAIGHLKHALELLGSLPDCPRRARLAFGLEVLLAQASIAGRGYAATETQDALLRARALVDDATPQSQKFAVLYGLFACYYVGGQGDPLQRAALDFFSEAQRCGDRPPLSVAHRLLGTALISVADFKEARRRLEEARSLYDPQKDAPVRYQYGQDIGAAALCYLSWAMWHLGYVDQASTIAAEAVERAEALGHPFTLVYTISHARGMIDIFRRRPGETRAYAARVISICNEHGFPFWAASGQILDGWAAVCEGDIDDGIRRLRAGLAAWRRTGARLWLPKFIALEGEAHAKAGHEAAALEAFALALDTAKETGEQWAVAEVLRMKASVLQSSGRMTEGEIEALLLESMQIARRQNARCWELRSACDLARLWGGQGRGSKAAGILRPIYDQFTEGFETDDLRDAKMLLDEIERTSEH